MTRARIGAIVGACVGGVVAGALNGLSLYMGGPVFNTGPAAAWEPGQIDWVESASGWIVPSGAWHGLCLALAAALAIESTRRFWTRFALAALLGNFLGLISPLAYYAFEQDREIFSMAFVEDFISAAYMLKGSAHLALPVVLATVAASYVTRERRLHVVASSSMTAAAALLYWCVRISPSGVPVPWILHNFGPYTVGAALLHGALFGTLFAAGRLLGRSLARPKGTPS